MKGEFILNKELEKKIEKLELLKKKELEKINTINNVIAGYDKQLKVLKEYKKKQERINKMQEDLDLKIKG